MGLVIILALRLYLGLAIGVVLWAMNYAKKHGKSAKRWGWTAALVMYLIPFWDWLPTVAAHKYYCATQAGFWVYKTPEQWMKENPKMKVGVDSREQITENHLEKYENGNKSSSLLNQRTSVIGEFVDQSMLPLLHITKKEEFLIDTKNDYLLAKKVAFQAGHPFGAPKKLSHLRFWVNLQECNGKNGNTTYENWASAINKYANIGEQND